MLRPPVTPKKRTPAVPEQPEIPDAWLEALNNSKPVVAPANAGTVSPYKYTSVRQADDDIMRKYFEKYPLAKKYMEQNNGQMSTKPESLVDGKRYGVYDAGKWGGAYDKLVGTNRILDFAIGDPIRSLFKHTLSGKNADTTFNPNSGASWDQRLGAFTEDALNIANLIPAAGAVDDAVRSGVPVFKNWLTSLAEKRAAAKLEKAALDFGPSIAPGIESSARLQTAAKAEKELADQMIEKQMDMKWNLLGNKPTEAMGPNGEDLIRIWHSNPQGDRLPGELLPMDKAARLPGRRGTGATQLLSGGPYGTRDYGMSRTYLTDVKGILQDDMPSNLPSFMTEYLVDVPANNPYTRQYAADILGQDSKLVDKAFDEIRDLQVRDLMDSVYSIDDPVNRSMFNPKVNIDKMLVNADGSPKTIRQLLDGAATPEQARFILDNFNRPIRSGSAEQASLDYFGTKFSDFDGIKASQISKEKFKHPIILNGRDQFGTPRYSDVSFTKPGEPLYLSGAHSKYSNKTFSKEYYEKLDKLAADFAADNPNLDNPYDYFKKQIDSLHRPNFQAAIKNPGGMNYWDLPVTRTAAGQIDTVGGLKALDALNFTEDTSKAIADNMIEFLRTKHPNVNANAFGKLIQKARNLHLQPDSATAELSRVVRDFGMELDDVLGRGDPHFLAYSDELTGKEEFYQFLNDAGYDVIPHTGGQMLGGAQHEAFNFLSPEKLPPANYIGGNSIADIRSLANAMQRQKAIQWREVAHNPLLDLPYAKQIAQQDAVNFRNKAKVAGLAGIKSMLVGSANNAARNR